MLIWTTCFSLLRKVISMPKPAHPDRRPVVISGASTGIGAATARAFAAAGMPVVLGARRQDKCEQIAEVIRSEGGEALALQLDVTDDDSVAAFAAAAIEAFGSPEIVVSNAGGVVIADAVESSTEGIAHDLNVNVLGAHRLIAAFVPTMIERQRGDIVFVSSDAVHTPRPGVAGYVAGKTGLEGLAISLRADLEGSGVRASVVRPGPTLSDIANGWTPEEFTRVYESWQHWGAQRHDGVLLPEHIAHAVLMVTTLPRGMHMTVVDVQPEARLPR
jgi:NADP-dependent 3-hydroxy acid dehydrogenase YdfG